MMRVIATGILTKAPERKTATSSGVVYSKCGIRVAMKQRKEDDPDSVMVWAAAFGETAKELLDMKAGDAIAFAGQLTVGATLYLDKPTPALNVAIDKLITATRPPRPQRRDAPTPNTSATLHALRPKGGIASMTDDIAF